MFPIQAPSTYQVSSIVNVMYASAGITGFTFHLMLNEHSHANKSRTEWSSTQC